MSMEPGKNGGLIVLLFPKCRVLTSLTDFHPCSVSFWALQVTLLRDKERKLQPLPNCTKW